MKTPATTDPRFQRLLIEKHILDILYKRHDDLKTEVAKEFQPGEKHQINNPQGLKLGSVSLSSPTPKAVCVDEAVALGMAVDKGMEIIDHLPTEGSPEYEQAVDVLMEHAPHLLPTPTVSKADVGELSRLVFEEWQITGKLPEGWEIQEASAPRFLLTKGRATATQAAIAHLAGEVEHLIAIEAPEEKDQ